MDTYIGALPDNRTEEQKSKDWSSEELFGMGQVVWKEKPESECRKFPISNQDGSGMCGPFMTTKLLGINEGNENGTFLFLNKAFLYNRRTNKGSGMYMHEVLQYACGIGAPTDPERISENINDEQASKLTFTDAQIEEAKKYRGSNFVYCGTNIDTIASIIDQGYGVGLLIGTHSSEYSSKPTVNKDFTRDDFNIWHFVTAVDYTLKDGVKCLVIEDSWGTNHGFDGRRIFTEEFIKARVNAGAYIIDLVIEDIEKPKFSIATPLVYGDTGENVSVLQKMLQYEKFLPTHTSKGELLPLGSYLGMTANAVKKWQLKHGITDFANQNDMRKIRFGQKSINLANSIYGL